jgi:hypothetical protein
MEEEVLVVVVVDDDDDGVDAMVVDAVVNATDWIISTRLVRRSIIHDDDNDDGSGSNDDQPCTSLTQPFMINKI